MDTEKTTLEAFSEITNDALKESFGSCNDSQCGGNDCGHKVNHDQENLTEIRFVGVEFIEKKIPIKEKVLNNYLQDKFQILERLRTDAGLVFILGKFVKTHGSVEVNPPYQGISL